jgi:homogentisate 1,2-dioxygenase
MVDTFAPLKLTQDALAIESPDDVLSWQPEEHGHPLPDAAPIPPGVTVGGDGHVGTGPSIDAAR